MMLAWILSPIGRWLSLVGAVFAALGVAWLKGRAAGKAAWQAAAGEAMPVIREGVGIMPVMSESLGRPAFIAALIVIAASVAIWVWRRQRLMEQGA